ncbi:MAG: ABC transporter substrate-binding protein [Bacteroidia bacterium]|nr:ABC transporter substrate-binding protein [Bacteroidia bacterium]MDW8347917.1 ABC transporter substrate-binding protein [Bacteroidia bacterium]
MSKLYIALKISFSFIASVYSLLTYAQEQSIHIRISKNIEALHPLISHSLTDNSIAKHIFYPLLDIEPKTHTYTPILLKALPAVVDGGRAKIYEIRENATWSDGKPVTAKDVIFTLKAALCPNLPTSKWRDNIKMIDNFEIDINNVKVFKITINNPAFTLTGIPIYPEHIYDKQNLLKDYTINQISKIKSKNIPSDITKFQQQFISPEMKKIAIGSGPYKVKEWINNNILVLERLTNWWGSGLDNSKEAFNINAKELHYEIMSDLAMTTVAFKLQQLDIWYDIPAKEFNDLQKLDSNYYHFALRKVPTLSYEYIAINNKPKDENKKFLTEPFVRKGIAHAIDVQTMQKQVLKGYGCRIACPSVPQKKSSYSKEIPFVEYNPQEAKKYLALSGWLDTNNDGILDQLINGSLTNLKLTILVNKEDSYDRKIAHFIIKDLQNVGVEIESEEVDSETELLRLQEGNYDLAIVSYHDKPGPANPRPLWHSQGIQNVTAFSNEQVDVLIEKIEKSKDVNEKEKLFLEFNTIWAKEQPAILLWQKEMLIAISEKYKDYKFSMAFDSYVGFNPSSFFIGGDAKR